MRSKNTRLVSVIESFLMHRHDLSERTRKEYGKTLMQFAKWLLAKGYASVLGDIDPNAVNQYVAERRRTSIWVARLAAATLKAFGS